MKKTPADNKISSAQPGNPRTRLRLARQTLRQLTTRELTAVVGGDQADDHPDTHGCTD